MSGASINLTFYLIVVSAGISVALQQVLNANLRTELASPLWAGLASYAVGVVTMLVAILATGEGLPSRAMIARASFVSWTGGVFGAFFIGAAIVAVPRLGVATVLALIVVGQMLGSLAFDHFGLLGLTHHPVSSVRLVGAALLIVGVVLIRY